MGNYYTHHLASCTSPDCVQCYWRPQGSMPCPSSPAGGHVTDGDRRAELDRRRKVFWERFDALCEEMGVSIGLRMADGEPWFTTVNGRIVFVDDRDAIENRIRMTCVPIDEAEGEFDR